LTSDMLLFLSLVALVFSQSNPLPVIFVHSVVSDTTIWNRVIPLLNPSSEYLAPSLVGHRGDPLNTNPATVTMDDYVNQITTLVDEQKNPVILVAHSFGGIIASQVASNIPSKIKAIVFITGFLPRNDSLVTLGNMQFGEQSSALPAHLSFGPNFLTCMITNIAEIAFNNCPLNNKTTTNYSLYFESATEPFLPLMTVVAVNAAFDAIPKYYIKTSLDDINIPPLQDFMLSQAQNVKEVITIESGHLPILCNAQETADFVNSVITLYTPSASSSLRIGVIAQVIFGVLLLLL